MIDMFTKQKHPFLRWWLLITLILITFVGLHTAGIIEKVYTTDVTKLSFLIFGEVPTILFVIGGIIVISSVILLHKIR